MAYISIELCEICGHQTQHLNRRCRDCSFQQRIELNSNWGDYTNEEKIEELLRRIKNLEARNGKYA